MGENCLPGASLQGWAGQRGPCICRTGTQSLRASTGLAPPPPQGPPSTHGAGSQGLAADGLGAPDGQRGQVVTVDVNLWGLTAYGTEAPPWLS